MEQIKRLVRHAYDYRSIALAMREPSIRARLIEMAAQCEEIAAEMAQAEAAREGGLGLQIVRSLVHEDLKGEFELLRKTSGDGLHAVVSFPRWRAKAE